MKKSILSAVIMLAAAMLILAGASPVSAENDRLAVSSFVERLKAHHPYLTCQDVYKALFQYVNGMEHSVGTMEEVRKNLEREVKEQADSGISKVQGTSGAADIEEPLVEFLSDDLKLCRINIRPYIHSGGTAEKLASAFIRSSQQFTGDPERFRRLWKTFMAMVNDGCLAFDRDEAISIDREAAASGYWRTFSHSSRYREQYSPSYRVIMTQYLESLW
ncbi:MAG: hypothetical protein AB9903_05045 [Vulcanimicrobiota bacterium]